MPVEQINKTPIAYEVTGQGAPLVLVHGAWVDGHTWDFVVSRLAESFLVVTYDLRGHGRSVIDPSSGLRSTLPMSLATPLVRASRCSSPSSAPSWCAGRSPTSHPWTVCLPPTPM